MSNRSAIPPPVAPAFDEVNNDNEELAAMRGEGRYFGVEEDLGPVCMNCHRRGHIRSQCKVVVCHLCGKVDDHYESQCPNSMVCTNCGKKGHYRSQCTERWRNNYCHRCESHAHSDDRCPNIWRSYIVFRPKKKKGFSYPSGRVYCYNCAQEGHYGDDCPRQRVSKTPNINGSAFTGQNLPQTLRRQYEDKLDSSLRSQRRPERRPREQREQREHRDRQRDPGNPRNRKERRDLQMGRSGSTKSKGGSASIMTRTNSERSKNRRRQPKDVPRGPRKPSKSGFLPLAPQASKPTRSGYLKR